MDQGTPLDSQFTPKQDKGTMVKSIKTVLDVTNATDK